jgi:hypothetical protein
VLPIHPHPKIREYSTHRFRVVVRETLAFRDEFVKTVSYDITFLLEVVLPLNGKLNWQAMAVVSGLISTVKPSGSFVTKNHIFDDLVPASTNVGRIR